MFSRFGKLKKDDPMHSIHDEEYRLSNQNSMNKMTGSEKEMKVKKISRRARGRNIVQTVHSDCDEELQSVSSDNPYFYTRSRSSNTLDNTGTKKHLLQIRGNKFVKVESQMKTIEKSLGTQETKSHKPSRNETSPINDMVYNLKKEILLKEKFIFQMNTQLEKLKQGHESHDQSTHLEMLETQMNAKILQMQEKHAKVSRLKSDGNMETKIDMAELEYKIEKDQLDILNISQKIQIIKMNLEKSKYTRQLTKRESLHSCVRGADLTKVIKCEVSSDTACCLSIRKEGFGIVVSQECAQDLQIGDRVLELDGRDVFKITRDDWDNFKSELNYPCKTVVMRLKTISKEVSNTESKDTNNLREDIALIQSRLEQKLNDGRNVSSELENVQKQKKALFIENTRLNHRIAYLEEHTQDLQNGLKQIRDSLSRTINTEIHFALSKLDNNEFGQDGRGKERSGSSTSGVYSSAESVGSDTQDATELLDRDSAPPLVGVRKTIQTKENNEHVSILNVGNDSQDKADV